MYRISLVYFQQQMHCLLRLQETSFDLEGLFPHIVLKSTENFLLGEMNFNLLVLEADVCTNDNTELRWNKIKTWVIFF